MTRSIIRFGIPLVGGTIVSLAAFACSSDSKGGKDKDDAGTGGAATGGGSNTGGRQTGGTTGSGGAGTGGAAGAPDLYECDKRPPRDPGGTGVVDSECCDVAGVKYGTCTLASSISDPIQRAAFGFDTCDGPDLKCAPTPAALADAGALGVFETCTWTVGTRALEGRCLPECFIAGNPAASQLTQGTCAANLLCAPCYNPIDGAATGACTFKAGDAPVQPVPTKFVECGAATDGGPPGGLCVPLSLAVASGNPAAASLPQLGCPTDEICAPTLKVQDLNACFAHCTSAASIAGPDYAIGGCVPYYLVAAVAPTGLSILTQDTCATGELCAPCTNPLALDDAGLPTRTGACD